MKRAFAVVLSAAFIASATAAFVAVPIDRAAAEMAAPEKKAKKKEKSEKSGMSFNERRKKCSAEWKEAKAAGKTSNWKWPKFWSDCNKRLKAGA